MQIETTAIPGVFLITPKRFADDRGWFAETWNGTRPMPASLAQNFVQDNHSYSRSAGTIRGLHCQVVPYAQGKLVRCIRGAIWDVAVDIRHGSPTYGQHVAAELSVENFAQLWIPVGFLHGFCTLQPDTEVVYKVTAGYDKGSERAVIWNDPDLALPWPVAADDAVLSDKDAVAPRLAECGPWFSA